MRMEEPATRGGSSQIVVSGELDFAFDDARCEDARAFLYCFPKFPLSKSIALSFVMSLKPIGVPQFLSCFHFPCYKIICSLASILINGNPTNRYIIFAVTSLIDIKLHVFLFHIYFLTKNFKFD